MFTTQGLRIWNGLFTTLGKEEDYQTALLDFIKKANVQELVVNINFAEGRQF